MKYTAYPCVALVNPGDNFKYILRLVNSGTESGTDMRVIDTFPAAGDKGIIAGEDRGTEWNNRPTLATEPVLTGPGTMTTLYTDKTDVCIKDLDMGGAGSTSEQCAQEDWAAAYGPNVTAAQFQLTFDPKIGPGEQVSIAFEMNAPLDVAKASEPTVAWNSFAHAETTDRNGNAHVLPPTEPIKVGVALAYGNLNLVKMIGENPSNLPVADLAFTYQVTCTIVPVGGTQTTVWDESYKVTSLAAVSVTAIPANATCKVWEVDAKGGESDHGPNNPLSFVIKPGLGEPSVATATITNDFPDAVVTLEKKVIGDAADFAQTSYPMDLFCTFGGTPVEGYSPKQVQVPANGSQYTTAVPPGSDCYVVETDDGGATEVTYLPAKDGGTSESGTVITEAGKPVTVQVTNDFRAGTLSVNKETAGAGAPELAQGPFTYSVVCSFNGVDAVITEELTIGKGEVGQTSFTSAKLESLPAGASCLVTETDNGGADYTPAPITVIIPDSDNVAVGFTGESANVFSAGTIGLAKVLEGDAAQEDYATSAVFTIMVTCQRDALDSEGNPLLTTVFSQSVDIKGGESVAALLGADGKPVKLPVGTHCFGVETNTGGATESSVDHNSFESAAVVEVQEDASALQELKITASNTFSYGELVLVKKLDGAAAGYVGEREFTLALTCQLDQGQESATAVVTGQEIIIKGGESITVDKLPVGANCWVEETVAGGASNVTIDHSDVASAAVVGIDEAVELSVVNTFDAGELTVSKKVVNGGSGPYTFALVCTTDQGPVTLAAGDAAFKLKGGEAKTISVPNGALCQVSETNVPTGDTVTYVASSGDEAGKTGAVAVNGEASVQVTNTFKVPPVVPGPDPEDLGNTGANGIAFFTVSGISVLLLGLVLMSRRRRTV